jgi:glucoamylase
MLLRASEDKTYRGAVVASFAIPWGDQVLDDPRQRANFTGYRRVWARDSYHIGMGLVAAGDQSTPAAILNYLDNVQQLATGAFPQNSYLDGSPSWNGTQLDEVADPILLAWRLNAVDRFKSLVKPAADFIVREGPSTPQDRWEEQAGYSPATLAAEVAGLFAAADLATRAGDAESARVYRLFGTRWAMEIPLWTFTRTGPQSGRSYFLRVTQDGKPDAQNLISISNSASVDQRSLVDPSFLELVRLGLLKPGDPLVTSTLQVVDDTLRVQTPNGVSWRRYQGDRYGERDRANAILDKGHLWPLLTGERGVYEFAAGHLEAAASLSESLAKFANAGGMIPEQIWEDTGTGTGSATPLLWAHAEYIVLLKALSSGGIIDQPSVVGQYLK